jgi:hypothetical protein
MSQATSLVLAAGLLLAPAAIAAAPESCEFRIVDWNASGTDANWNLGKDRQVADFIIAHVASLDANVITLQEVTAQTLTYLETDLPGWSCYAHEFAVDDHIAVCVDGAATNFFAARLTDVDPNDLPNTPPPYWWGYTQVEYEGVLITSVHTRSRWAEEHTTELHEDIPTGIIAGDFNYVEADKNPNIPPNPVPGPDWYQTDLDLEWTIDGFDDKGVRFERKIDHVLTVEPPAQVWGDAVADGSDDPPVPFHSAHRMLLATVSFQEDPSLDISITNPQQPIEVDGGCAATVSFQVAIHDNCCLDANDLGLDIAASNPTTNATLGAVMLDGVVALGPRDVLVTGHVDVSALQSCPAEVVIDASAQDCAGNPADTTSLGSGASAFLFDALPPQVASSQSDLACLWPPNHQYVCFDAAAFSPVIADNCAASPSWEFAACTSDQPDNGKGDGNTVDDCVLAADGQGFCARAERAGDAKAGRRYGLDVVATDACGNASAPGDLGNIHVPHHASPALACVAAP